MLGGEKITICATLFLDPDFRSSLLPDLKRLFRKNEPVQQFVNDPGNEHDDGDGVDHVHHLHVKIDGPVRVFLSEKVHDANLYKKKKALNIQGLQSYFVITLCELIIF
jgi:hypothetical protein